MVGKKEDRLKVILERNYTKFIKPINAKVVLASEYRDKILETYLKIGCNPDAFNYKGKLDFTFENFYLELYGEAHLNCYREIILESKLYNMIQYCSVRSYEDYCGKYEDRCIRKDHCGYWSNTSADK